MNSKDWMMYTGAYGRPVNPRLLARQPPATQRSQSPAKGSSPMPVRGLASTREGRRFLCWKAAFTASMPNIDGAIAKAAKRKARYSKHAKMPASYDFSPEANLRRTAILHRWFGPR